MLFYNLRNAILLKTLEFYYFYQNHYVYYLTQVIMI